MSTTLNTRVLLPVRDTRRLLIKWIVALLVPVAFFTFVWSGEVIVNNVFLGLLGQGKITPTEMVLSTLFSLVFYSTIIILAGYLVAADSGKVGTIRLWTDVAVFTLLPLFLIMSTRELVLGLALCAILWPLYILARTRVMKLLKRNGEQALVDLKIVDAEQKTTIRQRALAGSLWFASLFAVVSLIADLIFFATDPGFPPELFIWVAIRTIILPIGGYVFGVLAGNLAVRRVVSAANGDEGITGEKKKHLEVLSAARKREEAKDLVPNDTPLLSTGAQRLYLLLLTAFLICYPFIDPLLFGAGTAGRLTGYSDAGYYIILALGLNVVVGFAGLLDLGYVAFFAIGAYAWGMFASPQFFYLTGIRFDPTTIAWLFWPALIIVALLAAFWGVLLGAPTLRLRGDYLAIVTLGFGEIVPIVFKQMKYYTRGVDGLIGISSPAFFGIDWSTVTPIPYYYLILALIVLVIFANVRMRDSRLGRAWVAIREDEIAAASSGVNLVNTKLFAFGAGAFFSGIAGAYSAAKLGNVSPDAFSFGDSVIYLAMVVIGGIGSIPGVIVGAITVYAVNQLILAQLDTWATDPTSFVYPISQFIVQFIPGFTFGNLRNLIFGSILVAIMIFRPEGFIPSARRKRELHQEEKEVGALDAAPGSPGFETSVRVE